MYIGLHVKCPLFLSDFNETLIFSKVFGKNSNIKFHENPSSGSRVVPCGQTEGEREGRTDGRTGRHNELIATFRNFAKGPENVGRIQLRRPGLVEKMMLKLISRTLWLCERDSKLSQERFEWQGFCEHGNDTSGFVK